MESILSPLVEQEDLHQKALELARLVDQLKQKLFYNGGIYY